MSSFSTEYLRNSVAEEFISSFSDDNTSYYLFIGHVLPWSNEAAPDAGNTSMMYLRDVWEDMIAAKRIRGDSIRAGLPKRTWQSNTVYTQYSDFSTTYLSDANNKLYVINANNNVYKCIVNANGANSIVEPSGTTNDNGFIKTSDGYTWKYMYTLDSGDNLFVTTSYIPVPKLRSPNVIVIPGTVDRVNVTSVGFGYNGGVPGTDLAIVSIDGDGVGATALANVGANGAISTVRMISYGEGYSRANVIFTGGTGAIARAVISPLEGHGSHPAEELSSKWAIMAMRIGQIDATEGGVFTVQNDFRQFGLLKDPHKYGIIATHETATANVVSCTTDLTVVLDANPPFVIDEYVFQQDSSGTTVFSGYVVDILNGANTSVVKVTQAFGTPVVGSTIFNTGAATSKIVQSFDTPDIQIYTGKILYVENIVKVQRNSNQAETFKIIFDF